MHHIRDCVVSFQSLLNKEYKFILGRKSKLVELRITFDEKDCFHLMGLQYLKDRPKLNKARDKIFYQILNNNINSDYLEESLNFPQIKERIRLFPHLEEILDSNETIFKYSEIFDGTSRIKADFLLSNKIYNKVVYLFLSKDKEFYFCRSFFPKTSRDYTLNQTAWTLLYKSKIDTKTGKEKVLFDKLK